MWRVRGGASRGRGFVGRGLTEVLQHAVPLQLRVPDLVLQQDQLLLVLVLERLEPPLAVLQLVNQLLLDFDLAGQVGQVSLVVHLCGGRDRLDRGPGARGVVEGTGLPLASRDHSVTSGERK